MDYALKVVIITLLGGGWFIGTLVIFYAIFPLLYNWFKNVRTKPVFAFLICFTLFILNVSFWYFFDSLEIPGIYYNRTFFFYFSFINQLPSFVLGIYMYSIYESNKEERDPKAYYFFLFLLSFCLLLFFKYSDYEYGSIYTPYFVGLSFVYLFELTRRLYDKVGVCSKIMMEIGTHSFGMYLLNTFIAWEAGAVVHKLLGGSNDTLLYLIWLPLAILILYVLSIYYERIINIFSELIFK